MFYSLAGRPVQLNTILTSLGSIQPCCNYHAKTVRAPLFLITSSQQVLFCSNIERSNILGFVLHIELCYLCYCLLKLCLLLQIWNEKPYDVGYVKVCIIFCS